MSRNYDSHETTRITIPGGQCRWATVPQVLAEGLGRLGIKGGFMQLIAEKNSSEASLIRLRDDCTGLFIILFLILSASCNA